ncbi:MAG TPA: ABC transporter permease [Streptosporangiaceae bacterium]|nr:ABC transporter permease [Streptosporangiaceae bacterium]
MSRGPAGGRLARWLTRWLVLAAAIAAWQLWAAWHASPFFPPPSRIAEAGYQLWFSGPARRLLLTPAATANLLPSLGRVAGGLAIAVAVGGPAGIALGRSRALADVVGPLVHFGRSLPPVALVTVFIAVLRVGTEMEVAFIAFGASWPILVNTADGARSVDPVQVQTARVFRLTAAQRAAWLILPAAAPRFLAGLRISASLSLVLMVTAELISASNGIGYQMATAVSGFNLTDLWAGIALLAILGYVLNAAILAAEHRLLAWHHGVRALATGT